MKKISIVIPTYNEEENVVPMSEALIEQFHTASILKKYLYDILFIDNCSTDNTQKLLTSLCQNNKRIKAIFNVRNFGQFNSPYYGLCQATGDCVICMCADFQEPVDLIPKFVHEWEQGYKVVLGIKTSSKENRLMYYLRSCYYKAIKKFSDVEQIEHFTGFGLYDQSFINVMRNLDDPTPFLRGIVAELSYKRKEIQYEQQRRKAGKTKNNWATLYDAAMLSFTSYTKIGLRIATLLGFSFSAISLLVATVYLILKLFFWDNFPMGMAPVLLGVFIIGSVQLFFIGLLGEYIMNISAKVTKRPLVIEEKRLNFFKEENADGNILLFETKIEKRIGNEQN